MKTKLVYVLTSTEDMNYIEQAHISLFSARYHNTTAKIILLIDDSTKKVLVDKRAELLNYISELKVIDFPAQMGMKERSRQIKTNLATYVDGDFLFIDSDTIITSSLKEVDGFDFDMGAVWESHLAIADFHPDLFRSMKESAKKLDWDAASEKYYFSSGVIYIKDNPKTKEFFKLWNYHYNLGLAKGVSMDQPSFAKANIESGYLIKKMDDIWNCIMFTQPIFDKEAKIMHFSFYRNRSYIFDNPFLELVKNEGVQNNEFIKESILNPWSSYLPTENVLYLYKRNDFKSLFSDVKKQSQKIYFNLNKDYTVYLGNTRVERVVEKLFCKKQFLIGAILLTLYKFYRVKINKKFKYVENTNSNYHI